MRNEEVVEKIQKYHERRLAILEDHVGTLNREMGEVKAGLEGLRGVLENNRFWLKVIGLGTPGTVLVLWVLGQILERLS